MNLKLLQSTMIIHFKMTIYMLQKLVRRAKDIRRGRAIGTVRIFLVPMATRLRPARKTAVCKYR